MHQGNHAPVIERETWNAAQRLLADNRQGDRRQKHSPNSSLLAGRLVDEEGEPLIATHACKGEVRYRYYVSRSLQHEPDADTTPGMRIPAREIEAAVAERVAEALDDPIALAAAAKLVLHANELKQTMAVAERLAEQVRARDYHSVRNLVSNVCVSPREVSVDLDRDALAGALKLDAGEGGREPIPLVAKVRLTRTGRAIRLVHDNGKAASAGTPDQGLIALLVTARRWWQRLSSGEIDIATLSQEEGVNDSWMSRVIRINFLSPRVVETILTGTQPVTLTARWLRRNDLPLDWYQQWAALTP